MCNRAGLSPLKVVKGDLLSSKDGKCELCRQLQFNIKFNIYDPGLDSNLFPNYISLVMEGHGDFMEQVFQV